MIVASKVRSRISRQWPVGDGGMRGIRMVKDGAIRWGNYYYSHPKLIPLEGEWVFVEDFACPEITVSLCLWTAHYFTHCGHPYPGGFICEAKEVQK
jgi:hypothetical protein